MLAALLTLLTAVAPGSATASGPAAAPPSAAPPSATASSPALTPITPLSPSGTAVGDTVVDAVLPCGLRVLTAKDLSLPVAAVVLAVEVGSEDDPPELPGLVHALAYQLEQGNRELRPAEAIATAQDAGGSYAIATGLAQVRFESLVPVSRLDPMLWVESQRLRSPTAAAQRWAQSLGWAASDERGGSRLRPEALAFVHGAPGLAHDGRAAGKPLAAVSEAALATLLAAKFNYALATLVIVGPEAPERLLERVSPLFADLPPAARRAPVRSVGPRVLPGALSPGTGAAAPAGMSPKTGSDAGPSAKPGAAAPAGMSAQTGAAAPADMSSKTGAAAPADMSSKTGAAAPADMSSRPAPDLSPGAGATAPLARQRGQTFVWPVPPTAAAGAWATALCRAINRQRKALEPEEPRRARLTCDYEADARRGVLILRPGNAEDPQAFIRARLARLAPGGADAALLQAQAALVAQALRLAVRTPPGLARQLAMSAVEVPAAPGGPSFQQTHRIDELTGLAALADPAALARVAPGLLRVEDAVVLTFPEGQP
jgi:hypothetical protein